MPIFSGEGLMAGYIRDNSGNLIELVEHTDRRSASARLANRPPGCWYTNSCLSVPQKLSIAALS